MADIILFQPKCGIWDIMGVRPPTGLLSIANVPVDKGYEVVVVDSRINQNWKADIKKHISSGAKLVCLTTMVGEQIKYMMEASKFIKSINPEVLVVLGGSWAQTVPKLCMEDKNIDIVCYGEGDYILSDLMDYCEGNKNIKDVHGILYRNNGRITKTKERYLIKNLDELPKTPYHLINLKDYIAIGYNPDRLSISLMVSRGCPYRCTFCSIVSLYGRNWRCHSIERVMKEIYELDKRYGIKDFFFMDDNIAVNEKFFSDLVQMFVKANKEGRNLNWGAAGIRADSIMKLDEKTLGSLNESGCKNLDIGVESGNSRVLQLIRKDVDLETIRKANKRMSKYPIIIKFTFMAGFPTETKKEYLDTLKFRRILESENPYATTPIFNYTPFPNTELYQIALNEGFVPPNTLEGWADFNYTTWYKKYPSWLTNDKIKLIENSVFLSYFSNKKLGYKYANPLMSLMFKIYYPIANFRYNYNFFGFMVEKRMAEVLTKINSKYNLFNRIKKRY